MSKSNSLAQISSLPGSKSSLLEGVNYEIRGPIAQKAYELKASGVDIIELNIGNPGEFGFSISEKLVAQLRENIGRSGAYCHSKGLISARSAILTDAAAQGALGLDVESIFIGNGVSELICQSMQALLNPGDEILLPSPDYPLWSAATQLARGKPKYYRCSSRDQWKPDIDHLKSLVTPRTRGIVVINPNNPTGAVYDKNTLSEILEVARQHGLVVLSDEIYSKITYDGAKHHLMSSLADDVPVLTFNGLSKNFFACGLRCGWMYANGAARKLGNFLEGMTLLCSMRLCANVPAQHAIPVALTDCDPEIFAHTASAGRLNIQRKLCVEKLNSLPGVNCNLPQGALYAFPEIDLVNTGFKNMTEFCLRLLYSAHVLVVQGDGFNYSESKAFRVTFLPDLDVLNKAFDRIEKFLEFQIKR